MLLLSLEESASGTNLTASWPFCQQKNGLDGSDGESAGYLTLLKRFPDVWL